MNSIELSVRPRFVIPLFAIVYIYIYIYTDQKKKVWQEFFRKKKRVQTRTYFQLT